MSAQPAPAPRVRRWTLARRILVTLGLAGFLLFGAITLTVPIFAATAPAVLTIACAVLVYLAWPKKGPAQ